MNHIPARFTPVDALPPKSAHLLPGTLKNINPSANYQAILVRLLTGTIDFYCASTNETINQRNNYSLIFYQRNGRLSRNVLIQAFADFATLKDVDRHLASGYTHNNKFYREILFEFYNFFYQKSFGNNTTAFLHLYRILESAAYSIPLVWSSKAKGYEGTFQLLSKYFGDPKVGELGALRKFLLDFFDASNSPASIYNVHTKLQIVSMHSDWQARYFKTIIDNINDDDLYSSTPGVEIDIKFGGLTDLLIKIRNKYFHFLSGKDYRITSDDVPDPDEFFGIINEYVANWLSIILFQVLEFELS